MEVTGGRPHGGTEVTGGRPTGGDMEVIGGRPTSGTEVTGGRPTSGAEVTGGPPYGGAEDADGRPTSGACEVGGQPDGSTEDAGSRPAGTARCGRSEWRRANGPVTGGETYPFAFPGCRLRNCLSGLRQDRYHARRTFRHFRRNGSASPGPAPAGPGKTSEYASHER